MRRAAVIVIDGLGIGAAPDADRYGDEGSDTLGNVLRALGGLPLPNLEALGLGRCRPLPGVSATVDPRAAHGICVPASAGKDSTTGHWELCGVVLDRPFPTFPDGFPPGVIEAFARLTGRRVVGNRAASGTAILDELGEHHRRTGDWIVYTSADSVFQVAAHEEVVPVEELYAACRVARRLLGGEYGVARVIARPFVGEPGSWRRTPRRLDLSVEPPGDTLLDRLEAAGIPRVGVGKVGDLFAGRGIASRHSGVNRETYRLIEAAFDGLRHGLLLANVIEFDQTWGHRNDVAGFAAGLRELDAWIPRFLSRVGEEDLVIFTADHGNDPTTPSTDHSREVVPLLVAGPRVRPCALGERRTLADVGQTVAELFGVAPLAAGGSFLREVWRG
ncbi:MAG TPA: phosphopentomutase [Gemmatimonadales bacterium]|nr:phosphopentomutase [Gemmatimonadales bacterium]